MPLSLGNTSVTKIYLGSKEVQRIYLGSTQVYARQWTPADISTLAWYDAADASTITLNGSNVSQWDDKSGNGYHATQGTASLQPTNAASSFNGNNSLVFNSSLLGVPSITFPDTQASFYAVFNVNNDTSYAVFSDTNENHWDRFDGDGLTYANAFRIVRFSCDIGAPTNGPLILGYIANASTPSYIVTLNGDVAFTDTNTTFTFVNNLIGLGRGGTAAALNGNLGEVVMTPSALSTSDRQKLEGYLAHKWGLASNLPGAHPYKSTTPTI